MTSDEKTLLSPSTLGLLLDAADDSHPNRDSFSGGFGRRVLHLPWLFIFTVFIPITSAVVYYTMIASEVYVSESSFIVHSVQDQQPASGLGALLKGSGSGSGGDDNANVQEFMQSRDALRVLEKDADLRKAFESPNIDFFARFGGPPLSDKSFESLYRYYKKLVVTLESAEASTSISQLQVRAFTAEEAHLINEKLLEMGEKLVNTLNERLQADMVRFAQTEVADAEKKAETAQVALATYRNVSNLVDPENQSKMQLELTLKLQEDLIDTRNQIAQLSNSSANNPAIPSLQSKAKNLESEIASEMAKASGNADSLTKKASEYERLIFERDFLQKQLGEALSFLEHARTDAQRKQLYLERIVEPNLPDVAVEPKRLRNIVTIAALGFVCWGVISLFVAGVREHQQ